MSARVRSTSPIGLAALMIVSGAIGFVAAFALTLEKIAVLQNPGASLSCNFSPLVQCGKNLDSAQGSVFGFPNPLIGIAGFAIIVALGVAMLAGARFARWFWLLVNLGVVFALGFVIWLIAQSIFELGTLCPWCMVVWAATIPLFLAVTLHNARTGVLPLPARLRRAASAAYGWIPLLSIVGYLAIAVIAQLRLDVLARL